MRLALAGIALAAALASAARAEEPEAHVAATVEGEHHAAHAEHAEHQGPPPWRVGLFGLGVPGFELATGLHQVSGPMASAGGGLFLKWEASRAVTLGVAVQALSVPSEHALEVPVDLLVEFPFHASERVHLYLGIGLTISTLVRVGASAEGGEGTALSLGVVGGGGLEVWLSRRAALFAEINVALLRAVGAEAEGSTLAPGGAAGVLFAFGR